MRQLVHGVPAPTRVAIIYGRTVQPMISRKATLWLAHLVQLALTGLAMLINYVARHRFSHPQPTSG
ncbi:Uncharacterised protein [Mycobacteroides abscessus subsp. abscessus]|jgi:hypothetical protein|nr:Uncharacterised protein [Mycobacteroides abscessus subsp. abscessus]